MSKENFVQKQFEQVQDNIQKEFDRLQSIADAQVQTPKKIISYTKPDDKVYKFSKFDNTWGTYKLSTQYYFWRSSSWNKVVTQELLDSVLEQWDNAVAHWKSDNHETYLKNQKIVEHNKLQFERVKLIMETLGVKTSFTCSYFKTSRSRKLTTERSVAKWPEEVRDAIPMSCGWEEQLRKFDEKRKQIESFGLHHIKENEERLRKEAVEKAQTEKEQRKIKTLAMLATKYEEDLDASVDDLLSQIISECKYLYLAHYLELNRGDWTDGYDYAEIGLSGFNVESEQDQEIYDDIYECIESGNDGDIDGRIFRDTKWNYSVLYGMVDEKLMEDYNLIKEFVDLY